MIFYTLISRNKTNPKKWLEKIFLLTFSIASFIIGFNFIIDPYNITKYNVLDITHKFARDDRTEKIRYFKTLKKFNNIMIGSSRVYSINPNKVSELIGGNTYNFGLGTASVEDHLGILKYLENNNMLPQNIILGVDFYTFNKNIPPNKYFLKNKELNFLAYNNYKEDYISKLFSIDSFRASIKTLKNHLFNSNKKPRFDKLGWAGQYTDYTLRDDKLDLVMVKKEIDEEVKKKYSNLNYSNIDSKRVLYYEEIRNICNKNKIKLFIFNTPLHPLLLTKLRSDPNTRNALNEFVTYLSSFDNFIDLYNNKLIYEDIRNFHGATHTTQNAGDLIVKILLDKYKYNEIKNKQQVNQN